MEWNKSLWKDDKGSWIISRIESYVEQKIYCVYSGKMFHCLRLLSSGILLRIALTTVCVKTTPRSKEAGQWYFNLFGKLSSGGFTKICFKLLMNTHKSEIEIYYFVYIRYNSSYCDNIV